MRVATYEEIISSMKEDYKFNNYYFFQIPDNLLYKILEKNTGVLQIYSETTTRDIEIAKLNDEEITIEATVLENQTTYSFKFDVVRETFSGDRTIGFFIYGDKKYRYLYSGGYKYVNIYDFLSVLEEIGFIPFIQEAEDTSDPYFIPYSQITADDFDLLKIQVDTQLSELDQNLADAVSALIAPLSDLSIVNSVEVGSQVTKVYSAYQNLSDVQKSKVSSTNRNLVENSYSLYSDLVKAKKLLELILSGRNILEDDVYNIARILEKTYIDNSSIGTEITISQETLNRFTKHSSLSTMVDLLGSFAGSMSAFSYSTAHPPVPIDRKALVNSPKDSDGNYIPYKLGDIVDLVITDLNISMTYKYNTDLIIPLEDVLFTKQIKELSSSTKTYFDDVVLFMNDVNTLIERIETKGSQPEDSATFESYFNRLSNEEKSIIPDSFKESTKSYINYPKTSNTVAGTILDSSNNPIIGANVTLNSNPRNTSTNSNGYYEFLEVPFGEHTISATFEGNNIIDGSVSVESDSVLFDVNIVSGYQHIELGEEIPEPTEPSDEPTEPSDERTEEEE